jgi:hypothetical protein
VGASGQVGILDALVARVLTDYPYTFTLPASPLERTVAFRLRGRVVGADLDRDRYDDVAVQVVGWADGAPVCTGRLVFPPHPLPTEDACGLVVEPAGLVVDVGRMCVAPEYRSFRSAAFVALLCRLYLEMRERGLEVACGMMAPGVRRLLRQLGLVVDELAPDRPYLGEERAPIRFSLVANQDSLTAGWG